MSSSPPRPRRTPAPLYRLSIPDLYTRIGTAEQLVAFGQWLARWIDAGRDQAERDRRLNGAAEQLTCELVCVDA